LNKPPLSFLLFFSGLLFSLSLSLSTVFIVASVEEGCLQPWLRRNNCCCSLWLLLKSLKSVLPLLRIEGCCWKCKGVADARGCALGKEERKEGFPLRAAAGGGLHLLPVAGAVDDDAAMAGACSRCIEMDELILIFTATNVEDGALS
jgi:hypothetical protein